MTPTQPPYLTRVASFLLLLLVVPATSLMCYSCQSSQPFSDCESNVRELRKGIHSKYAINCSDYSDMGHNYCAIEAYMQHGEVMAMIRDCNDGMFSFTMDNYPYVKMKHLSGLSNVSVCTYSQGKVICGSLCDTDMCNGPSAAAGYHGPSHWTFWFLAFLIGWAFRI